MKLIKITKNDSLHFELSDKRIGVVYKSGYVRVSTKGGFSNTNRKLYQINKQKLNYSLDGKNYFYTRELENNPEERVKMLYAFNQKNCV